MVIWAAHPDVLWIYIQFIFHDLILIIITYIFLPLVILVRFYPTEYPDVAVNGTKNNEKVHNLKDFWKFLTNNTHVETVREEVNDTFLLVKVLLLKCQISGILEFSFSYRATRSSPRGSEGKLLTKICF